MGLEILSPPKKKWGCMDFAFMFCNPALGTGPSIRNTFNIRLTGEGMDDLSG